MNGYFSIDVAGLLFVDVTFFYWVDLHGWLVLPDPILSAGTNGRENSNHVGSPHFISRLFYGRERNSIL